MKNSENFSVEKEKNPENIKFFIKGRVHSIYADELMTILEEALKDGERNIILNMFWVEFLSSSGIRVILKAYKDAKKAGGSLSIEMPSENVKNVLGMVVLDELLIH